MIPQILYRVLFGTTQPNGSFTEDIVMTPARLPGYKRHRVRNCDYPAIIPVPNGPEMTPDSRARMLALAEEPSNSGRQESSEVHGVLVTGLTDANIWRLDKFEGDQYSRMSVLVHQTQADTSAQTETYVWTGPRCDLDQVPWDFEHFKRERVTIWTGSSQEYEGWYPPHRARLMKELDDEESALKSAV